MNILIIGHSVVDKIIERNIITTKPGGIFYSVIAMLSQQQSGDKIFLCTSIDNENESLFSEIYNRVEKNFLTYANFIPEVELTIKDFGEREEKYSRLANNLSIPDAGYSLFDGILINMISGNDISIDQLKQIRKNFNGLIYFDVHTFSRGADENLKRIFRRINNFNEWAECIDILQANESELTTLSDRTDESHIAEELISYGINQVIVTKAEHGATVYFKEKSVIKNFHNNAIRTNVLNKVGCGDIFGAVYFNNYIKNKDVTLALKLANMLAGISTTVTEARSLSNLNYYADEWISKK